MGKREDKMAQLTPQLAGFHLTTADILYHLPDYPDILQSFLWQNYDKAPEFPNLKEFLGFWEQKIDARLHSIQLSAADLITPGSVEWPGVEIKWQ